MDFLRKRIEVSEIVASAALVEELLHHFAALFLKHAAGDNRLWMQGVGSKCKKAALLVATAVNDVRHLRPA